MSSDLPKLIVVKKVLLGPHHPSPGKTRHTLSDSAGIRPFPPFKSLQIAHYPGSVGYYLFYFCADGKGTDTWHQSLEDALHQAEWELGVRSEEWTDTLETYG
jgi:hypothetical protein